MRDVYGSIPITYPISMQTTFESPRRSHLHRRAMAKGVQITDNDIRDIFEPLARHAQLTTRQLVAFGQRHPVITKARLGELWHATQDHDAHWLHRVNEDLVFANHLFAEDLHRLGLNAEALLIARGTLLSETWVAASRIGGQSTMPSRIIRLAHDHMASDIALDIEIGSRTSGAPFRSHIDILNSAPDATRALKRPLRFHLTLDGQKTFTEPDALFAIGNRLFALEADKGTESIAAVIVPKLHAYREIVAAGIVDDQFGFDNLTVLFVTLSETRMRNIMAQLAKIARNGRSTMFAFCAEPVFGDFLRTPAPTGRLLTSPWQRVGNEPLKLGTQA